MSAAAAIEPAGPADAGAIVAMFLAENRPEVAGLSVLGTARAAQYVAASIEVGAEATRFWVARDGTAVLGFAELRLGFATTMLNHITVASAAQGRGVGRRLLAGALGATAPAGQVMLDVDEDNSRARAWYERLGFSPEGGHLWHTAGIPTLGAEPFLLRGMAMAAATYEAFGLAEFEIVTPAGIHPAGLLGEKLFRLRSAAALADAGVAAALRHLDAARLVLLRLETYDPGAAGLSAAMRTVRYVAPAPQLLARLAG